MLRTWLTSLVVFGVLVGCGRASSPTPTAPTPSTTAAAPAESEERVDGARARALVQAGARLVDVRSAAEYADGHVDGAENIPVDVITERDLGDKDRPVVVYCASGKRSARAAAALRARGYTRVYDLGAMSRWHD